MRCAQQCMLKEHTAWKHEGKNAKQSMCCGQVNQVRGINKGGILDDRRWCVNRCTTPSSNHPRKSISSTMMHAITSCKPLLSIWLSPTRLPPVDILFLTTRYSTTVTPPACLTTDTHHTHIPMPERSARAPVMQSPFAQHTRLRSVIHPSPYCTLFTVNVLSIGSLLSFSQFICVHNHFSFLNGQTNVSHFGHLQAGKYFATQYFFCIHGVGFPCHHMPDTIVCAIYCTWLILSPLTL
jgi:hypothetical protein